MYKIALINMPFAGLSIPSLGLTQLQSVLNDEFGQRVSVEIHYLNHAFAHYMGLDLYQYISVVSEGLFAGEWFFRQAAFPELPDNTKEYFRHCYPRRDERIQAFQRLVQEKRQGLDDVMDEWIARYRLDRAQIVGFTSLFLQNTASFALARKIKERCPDVITVMGGANCQAPMGNAIVKNVKSIDFVFSGPALKSLPEFVRYCLDGELDKCHTLDGVFSKKNRVAWLPQASPTALPDSGDRLAVGPMGPDLPMDKPIELDYGPFLDALEKNFPNGEVGKVLLFETSRGCWWGERSQCTFCGLNGMDICYRAMPAEKALEQFESLLGKYASRCPHFWAVDNIMPKDYPKTVFAHLTPPPGAMVGYEVRPDLTEEELQMLGQAGVSVLQPGIEALATPALKWMRKGSTAFQNLCFLKRCAMHNIYPCWNFLVGFPGEDKETAEAIYKKYQSDIPRWLHLPPPIGALPVRFERYSHYFYHAQDYGLDLRPSSFYKLIFPFDETSLNDLAYYFDDAQNLSAGYFVTMLKWISKLREQIDRWWARWHGDDQAIPPRLFVKGQGESTVVYDSRPGEVVEHPIGDAGRRLLEYLAQPRRAADLAALGDGLDFDPEQELGFLQERGLVFQEGDRYMSLVFPKGAPPLAPFPQDRRRWLFLSAVFPYAPAQKTGHAKLSSLTERDNLPPEHEKK